MAKVLVVTDYYGTLHITPVKNKAFYQSRNKIVKNNQYGLQEMDEKDAQEFVEKNKGQDPKFVKPSDVNATIAEKDKQIADLQTQLDVAQGNLKATELIDKIKAATTKEEVNALIAKDEARATVIAAKESKLQELKGK